MIEAELKSDVREPARVADLLARWGDEDPAIYRDTYYELPDRALDASGREFLSRRASRQALRHDRRRCCQNPHRGIVGADLNSFC